MRHDMILYFLLFFYILQYYESHSIPTPVSGPHDDLEWTNASLPFLKKVNCSHQHIWLLLSVVIITWVICRYTQLPITQLF